MVELATKQTTQQEIPYIKLHDGTLLTANEALLFKLLQDNYPYGQERTLQREFIEWGFFSGQEYAELEARRLISNLENSLVPAGIILGRVDNTAQKQKWDLRKASIYLYIPPHLAKNYPVPPEDHSPLFCKLPTKNGNPTPEEARVIEAIKTVAWGMDLERFKLLRGIDLVTLGNLIYDLQYARGQKSYIAVSRHYSFRHDGPEVKWTGETEQALVDTAVTLYFVGQMIEQKKKIAIPVGYGKIRYAVLDLALAHILELLQHYEPVYKAQYPNATIPFSLCSLATARFKHLREKTKR